MAPPEVTVIDYGTGNLLSVQRGLEHCGAKVILTADAGRIYEAKRVLLPGVGAFGKAMQALEELKLVKVIQEIALRQIPLLGICLGMQLLFEESEEFGVTPGLSLISGRVIAVPTQTKVNDDLNNPHIGWSELHLSDASKTWSNTLLENNDPGDSAYFVHSFMAMPKDPSHRIADCVYGGHLIPAAIAKDNIMGCQFHPEKSGEVGLKILRRFILQ